MKIRQVATESPRRAAWESPCDTKCPRHTTIPVRLRVALCALVAALATVPAVHAQSFADDYRIPCGPDTLAWFDSKGDVEHLAISKTGVSSWSDECAGDRELVQSTAPLQPDVIHVGTGDRSRLPRPSEPAVGAYPCWFVPAEGFPVDCGSYGSDFFGCQSRCNDRGSVCQTKCDDAADVCLGGYLFACMNGCEQASKTCQDRCLIDCSISGN